MSLRWQFPVFIFLLAALTRIILLFTVNSDLRHGSAGPFGSAALGLYYGQGLSLDISEVDKILSLPSNLYGDYRQFHVSNERTPFTEFLPGPALVLALLWCIGFAFNFGPYLVLQSLLDSMLIAAFYVVVARYNKRIAMVTSLLMTVNVVVIRRTLMMGYDFWPQFAVLVTVLGILYVLDGRKRIGSYLVLGSLTACPIWFRDITTLLPLFVIALFIYVLRTRDGMSYRDTLARVACYAGPILLSVLVLGMVRYESTGNFRPTRSTFWHSAMAGIGQFSNPYGVTNLDASVWDFARRVDPSLRTEDLAEMGKLPNSPYEVLMKTKVIEFAKAYPELLARNMLYRTVIMISPPLYADGDFIPKSAIRWLLPLGVLLIPLWVLGMVHINREHRLLFMTSLTIYVYFILSFSWFYVVGRVILPFLFLSIMVWLFGVAETLAKARKVYWWIRAH